MGNWFTSTKMSHFPYHWKKEQMALFAYEHNKVCPGFQGPSVRQAPISHITVHASTLALLTLSPTLHSLQLRLVPTTGYSSYYSPYNPPMLVFSPSLWNLPDSSSFLSHT